jgi:hypothetical protein
VQLKQHSFCPHPQHGEAGEEEEDGKRRLFAFLTRRMHGTWGDPVIGQAALEPMRSRRYISTGGDLRGGGADEL